MRMVHDNAEPETLTSYPWGNKANYCNNSMDSLLTTETTTHGTNGTYNGKE